MTRREILGPVQVLVLGIDARGSGEMISAELQDLANQSAVRVVDLLRARRETDGEMRRIAVSDPSGFPGTLVEALIFAGPERPSTPGGRRPRTGSGAWFLTDRAPRGTTVAILLIEHRWAIPLREAIVGFEADVFGDAWVHPRDLAAARRMTPSI